MCFAAVSLAVSLAASNEGERLRTLFKVLSGDLHFVRVEALSGGPDGLYFAPPSGKQLTILRLGDLEGKVRIETEQQALNFARLRGSPATRCAITRVPEFEVILRDDVDGDYVFGLAGMATELRTKPIGYCGLADRALVEQSGSRLATTKKVGNSYEITRTLLTIVPDKANWTSLALMDVREVVGRNGAYRCEMLVVRKTDRSIWWVPQGLTS